MLYAARPAALRAASCSGGFLFGRILRRGGLVWGGGFNKSHRIIHSKGKVIHNSTAKTGKKCKKSRSKQDIPHLPPRKFKKRLDKAGEV